MIKVDDIVVEQQYPYGHYLIQNLFEESGCCIIHRVDPDTAELLSDEQPIVIPIRQLVNRYVLGRRDGEWLPDLPGFRVDLQPAARGLAPRP